MEEQRVRVPPLALASPAVSEELLTCALNASSSSTRPMATARWLSLPSLWEVRHAFLWVRTQHVGAGPFTKIWLENKSQDWKNKYIAGWISLSGVFGGAAELLQAQIGGDPAYQVNTSIVLV